MTQPDPDPIAQAFALQRAGSRARREGFGLDARRAALERLRAGLIAREAELLAALAADLGKPEAEALLTEILPLHEAIGHARRHLRGWMRARRVAPTLTAFGTAARIRPEPRGVALIVAPWNYPLLLALSPLVSALAAGNAAIVKPSELTPATSAAIARLVAEAFPPDLVTVVEGGPDTAQALLALPFDHVFFTGSPRVGRIVMAAAAAQLASVTLELGGKSPTIVGPGADVGRAAAWVAFGKFVNAGQTCIAPDHVFVHESLRPAFIAALRARIARAYGGGKAARQLARIVNAHHAARLRGLVDEALAGGARLVEGTGTDGAPTLIEAVTPEMAIDGEEIFGPVLPIIGFHDLDEVVARVNARPKPLALYVFDRDRGFAQRAIAAIPSGGAGINLTVLHYAHTRLPFGGVGASGLGAAGGWHGFRAFSHERAVLENRFSPMPLLFPPYGARATRLLRLARRLLG